MRCGPTAAVGESFQPWCCIHGSPRLPTHLEHTCFLPAIQKKTTTTKSIVFSWPHIYLAFTPPNPTHSTANQTKKRPTPNAQRTRTHRSPAITHDGTMARSTKQQKMAGSSDPKPPRPGDATCRPPARRDRDRCGRSRGSTTRVAPSSTRRGGSSTSPPGREKATARVPPLTPLRQAGC